jgi:hypothetical protein
MPRYRLPLSRDAALHAYLSLLRYGTTERYHQRAPVLNLTAISKLTGLKHKRISDLLKVYQAPVEL